MSHFSHIYKSLYKDTPHYIPYDLVGFARDASLMSTLQIISTSVCISALPLLVSSAPIGWQTGMERFIRAAIMLGLYAALFGWERWSLHSTRKAHIIILRLLGCQACPAHLPPPAEAKRSYKEAWGWMQGTNSSATVQHLIIAPSWHSG